MSVTLTINGTSFRRPNRIVRNKTKVVVSERSLNNTLLTDIIDFPKKETLVLYYNMLTNAERITLETWIDNGAFTVVISDASSFYTYNASSILSYDGYEESFAGYKTGVKVKIEQI